MNHCCEPGCDRPAEFEVREHNTTRTGTHDGYTHACRAHVGEMLGSLGLPTHGEPKVWWEVYRLEPS